jgi:valyl-tRNA synthetase
LSGGEKMSKTKGTGVDPLQMTQQYGTDALRFMLVSMAAPGTDIILSEDRILSARAFANKIWNAARFLFFNLEKIDPTGTQTSKPLAPSTLAAAPFPTHGELSLVDAWIFQRLKLVTAQFNDALQEFRFHEACHVIYQFFWGDFCDWYIEWTKPRLSSDDPQIALSAWRNIFAAFDAALRLLHPIMPFLTEELWHQLLPSEVHRSIALQPFPDFVHIEDDPGVRAEMTLIQEVIVTVRNIRAEMKVDAKRKVAAEFSSTASVIRVLVRSTADVIVRLGTLSSLTISDGHLDSAGGTVRSTAQFDLRIAYGEGADKQAETAKLKKEIDRLAKDIESKQKRLADQVFLSKAPAKIVDDLKATLADRQIEHQKLLDRLRQLE